MADPDLIEMEELAARAMLVNDMQPLRDGHTATQAYLRANIVTDCGECCASLSIDHQRSDRWCNRHVTVINNTNEHKSTTYENTS